MKFVRNKKEYKPREIKDDFADYINLSEENKIKTLRKWIDDGKLDCLIEVDGGINQETGRLVAEAGVDAVVAGSYVFGGDIKERCASLC